MATEKRLIDAYKLEKLVEGHRGAYFHRDDVVAAIAAQPTVDAVEVVRCKECEYWDEDCRCNGRKNGLVMEYTDEDDFCSYGKRKANA